MFLRCFLVIALFVPAVACSRSDATVPPRPLVISAIPDQDPERLQRLYGTLATYLSNELKVTVQYKPVTDYAASVTAFKVGELDLVWYGGLTGTQARLQVPNAHAIAQRDVDEQFHFVVIANKASGISSLADIKGHTFTFGSESSTSGRLMPQHFLKKEGITIADFKGEVGFSGSHDKTVKLVAAGAYEAGVLNAQVWKKYVEQNLPEYAKVKEICTSPPFHDYHWVLHPAVTARYGEDFAAKVESALLKLDEASSPEQKAVLELFGAKKFIRTSDANYQDIEAVGRELGLIVPR
jgi:phosphonate transport system substrate-binding protein